MNMTGDPNQQTRPGVFGFDYTYPSASMNTFDWTRFSSGSGTFSSSPINNYNSIHNIPLTSHTQSGSFPFSTTENQICPTSFQFSQPIPSTSDYNRPPALRCKRKTNSPPLQTVKQHITEEKMAEHMSKLHISSETASTSGEPEPVREKRLYMCEEMRRLQTESIVPQSLLSRIQRPCTALVLWTPPPRIPALQQLENNNDEDEPDNNHMELDPNM